METLPDELVRAIGNFVPEHLTCPISKHYGRVWRAQAKRVALETARSRLLARMPLNVRAFRLEADCCPVCGRWMPTLLDLTTSPPTETLMGPFCAAHNDIFCR